MKVWTDAMLEVLARDYPDRPTREIAQALGLKTAQVHRKAGSLGIRKSREFLAGPHARRLKGTEGEETRFKPGQTPWNKGKPKSTGTHPNSVRHHFKKGERRGRANAMYRPVGSYRVSAEGYLEVKIDENPQISRRWKGVHRILWEAVHGPVPKGHIVVFKRGLKTAQLSDITLDKLELVSRAENMRRNSIHNLPKDIAQALQMLGALNRKINNAELNNR